MLSHVRSELTKMKTLPSLWVTIITLVALLILIESVQIGSFIQAVENVTNDGRIEVFSGHLDPARVVLSEQMVALTLNPILFVWLLGAIFAGTEYRNGQLGISVLATPQRSRLVLAKVIATALVSIILSLVFIGITTGFMYIVVKRLDVSILWSPPVLWGYGRILAIAALVNILTLGITLVARRILFGVIAMALMLGLTMTQVVVMISPHIDALLPYSAIRNLLFYDATDIYPPLSAGPAVGAIVLVAWAVASVVLALIVVGRRDAR